MRLITIGPALICTLALSACDGSSPDKVKVPNVLGQSASEAGKALDEAELRAAFEENPSDRDACRVTEQAERAGTELEPRSAVKLRCEVDVPSVVGGKARSARAKLTAVGLSSRYINPSDNLSRCRVSRQSASGSVPPDANVALRLKCK